MIRRSILVVAFLLASWSAGAQTQRFVILDSHRMDGARYLPGATIAAGERVDVPTGSRIVLLSAGGEVLRLNGPISHRLPAGPPPRPQWLDRLRQLAEMITAERPRQTTVSGVRSVAAERDRPRWAIDPSSGGVKCVARGGLPTIWLPQTGGVRRLTIKHLSSGAVATVRMTEEVTIASWPETVPLADGGEYQITIGRTSARSIIVAIVDASASLGEAALVAAGRACDEAPRLVAEILGGRP